jgi:hypothetical protein
MIRKKKGLSLVYSSSASSTLAVRMRLVGVSAPAAGAAPDVVAEEVEVGAVASAVETGVAAD